MNRKTIATIEITAGITMLLVSYLIASNFYVTAIGGVLLGFGIKDFLK